jgi:hypothetical protein
MTKIDKILDNLFHIGFARGANKFKSSVNEEIKYTKRELYEALLKHEFSIHNRFGVDFRVVSIDAIRQLFGVKSELKDINVPNPYNPDKNVLLCGESEDK